MNKKIFRDKALMKKRISLALTTLICLFTLLIIRLSYIMIVKREEYSARAEEQWTSEVKIDARRGKILDRNGLELAISANVYRVDFDLNSIKGHLRKENLTINDIAPSISEALNMDEKKVIDKLNTKLPSGADAGAAILVRRIEKDEADKVKNLNIPGVIVSPDTKRYYPNGNFLAHVLGSTNIDGQGLTGVELEYNEYLSGKPGLRISELSKYNDELPYTISEFTAPVNGKDLVLTIDSNLQAFAEKVAEKGYKDNLAKQVSIIIMNPNNGEILAMVNKPDFDPNKPYEGAENYDGENLSEKVQKMWRNHLVNDTFEPGSIFKVVTMIGNLEEGLVKESDTFNCNGSLKIGPHTIKCWKTSGHGTQTLPEILQNSCNVGFMEIGKRIGKEKLNEYIKKLGFGQVSGIDLPGEAKGIIKKTENINEADLATISFGQTNTVNAVQYMTAYNSIINGGKLIQPHLMKEITYTDQEGKVVTEKTFEPNIVDVLSEEKTAILRDYLERTVSYGGSSKAYVEGYHIGAKTGTAQKVNPKGGGYESGKYISSLAGFAPADDPQITVFISIDEPGTGTYYAGQIVAPLANILFTDIFNYMSENMGKDDIDSIVKEIVIPEIRGLKVEEGKKILKEYNIEYNINGNGDIITNVKPYPGYTIKENSKINIDTGDVESYNKYVVMPELRGYTLEVATKILDDLGIAFSYDGEGIIVKQSIQKGEIITKGTKVKLELNEEYGD
ncbi:MAG: stage V sporulation protein D [Clostridium sp.]|uniref:stage V sporulation protein D n=1 Tax=Clostridium sp. TaxID=1506 RepID=UPI002A765BFA|nr:stage V sporulation protein D [Clostridium sp.]MCI6693125.1 stage V sporulation protein D [Clostridium sp.]MDY2629787.1 stage V sporulation protein D [Clostridium sp.]MDY4253550.1 stage V sporulation protein D [Clostridium sp.]